jgi:hypothetical protein
MRHVAPRTSVDQPDQSADDGGSVAGPVQWLRSFRPPPPAPPSSSTAPSQTTSLQPGAKTGSLSGPRFLRLESVLCRMERSVWAQRPMGS